MDELNNKTVTIENPEEKTEETDAVSVVNDDKTSADNKKTVRIAFAVMLFVIVVFSCIMSFIDSNEVEEESTEAETSVSEKADEAPTDADESKKSSLFSNGLVSVLKDGKWGYMNEAGEVVIDYQFERANPFNEKGIASVSVNGTYGLIDKTGKYVVNPQYDYVSSYFKDGYSIILKEDKYGFIDMNGKIVIDCYFDSLTPFRNGYAVVLFGDVYGVIDTNGKYVINPQYDDLTFAFSEASGKNIFIAGKNGKYGLIDITGNTVVDFQFERFMWNNEEREFVEDKYAVVRINDNCGVVDVNGKYLINAIYDYLWYCGDGIFVFSDYDADKKGFVSVDGVETVAAQFDYVGGESDGLILVKLGDYFGYVDHSGTYIINPVFDYASSFSNGYAVVQKDEKYSFINTKGELIVDYQFDDMTEFNSNGFSIVRLNDRYGVINNKGEYVLNCQYKYVTSKNYYLDYVPLYDDYFCVFDDDKIMKIITVYGEVIAQGFDGIAGEMYDICNIDDCYDVVTDNGNTDFCHNHTFYELSAFSRSVKNSYDYWSINLSDGDMKLTLKSSCAVDDYYTLSYIEDELQQIIDDFAEWVGFSESTYSEKLVDETNHTRIKYQYDDYFDLIMDYSYTESENQYNLKLCFEAVRK